MASKDQREKLDDIEEQLKEVTLGTSKLSLQEEEDMTTKGEKPKAGAMVPLDDDDDPAVEQELQSIIRIAGTPEEQADRMKLAIQRMLRDHPKKNRKFWVQKRSRYRARITGDLNLIGRIPTLEHRLEDAEIQLLIQGLYRALWLEEVATRVLREHVLTNEADRRTDIASRILIQKSYMTGINKLWDAYDTYPSGMPTLFEDFELSVVAPPTPQLALTPKETQTIPEKVPPETIEIEDTPIATTAQAEPPEPWTEVRTIPGKRTADKDPDFEVTQTTLMKRPTTTPFWSALNEGKTAQLPVRPKGAGARADPSPSAESTRLADRKTPKYPHANPRAVRLMMQEEGERGRGGDEREDGRNYDEGDDGDDEEEEEGEEPEQYEIPKGEFQLADQIVKIVNALQANKGEPGIPHRLVEELPSFAGKYEDWPSFWDMFSILVDQNKRIATIVKLKILAQSLHGEARELAKNFTFEEQSYEKVKTALMERYGQPYAILVALTQRVLHHKPIPISDLKGIRDYMAMITQLTLQMEKYDPGSTKHPWYLLASWKGVLPTPIMIKWEEHRAMYEPPTEIVLSEFTNFVNTYVDRLRLDSYGNPKSSGTAASNTSSTGKMRMKSSFPREGSRASSTANFATLAEVADQAAAKKAMRKKTKCIFCQGPHIARICRNRPSVTECHRLVKEAGLCFKCLAAEHQAKDCTRTCGKGGCTKNHHRFLHVETKVKPKPS